MSPEPSVIAEGAAFERLGLVHRLRVPSSSPAPHPTIVMVHGFLGNENVTWIFERAAALDWLLISMRAPMGTPVNGFRWYDVNAQGDPDPAEFAVGLNALTHFMDALPKVYPVDPRRMVLLGFSQGAAMSYAYAVKHRVLGVASLSGFISPLTKPEIPPLDGLPILMLHGTLDETIPVAVARKNRELLTAQGATVTYLESEIGHKVSAAGMRELKGWLAARLKDSPPVRG
jgi:phospholipase/carboxylesterase